MYLDNNLHISFVHDSISLHVNHKQMIYGGVDGTVILSSLLPIWHICTMCITSIVCFLLHFYISINLLKGTWTEQRKEFNCNAYAASKKCKLFICTKWIIAEMSLLLFHRQHCRSVLFSLFCSILFFFSLFRFFRFPFELLSVVVGFCNSSLWTANRYASTTRIS